MTLDDAVQTLLIQSDPKGWERLNEGSSWTLESREDLLDKAKQMAPEGANHAVEIIKTLLNTEINGSTALFWYLEFVNQYNLLVSLKEMREVLDNLDDTVLSNHALTYEWVTSKIREQTLLLQERRSILEQIDPLKPIISEL